MIKGAQELVNAQMEVNRAVFEMNKPGLCRPEKERPEYIRKCVESAIKELQTYLQLHKCKH
jgi:hypothetical protein